MTAINLDAALWTLAKAKLSLQVAACVNRGLLLTDKRD